MKNYLKNICLLLVVLFSCFIIAETLCRLFVSSQEYGYPTGLFVRDDILKFGLRQNFTGHFIGTGYSSIEIKTNSRGMRDYEHDYIGKENKYRVVAIGDSVTFGAGLDFNETWLYKLEKQMNHDKKTEIIKAGVRAYNFEQEHDYYVTELYKYKPNLIIIGIVLDDLRVIENQYTPTIKNKILSTLNSYCAICKFAYGKIQIIQAKQKGHDEDYNEYYFSQMYSMWNSTRYDAFETQLLDLVINAEKINASVLVVVFPNIEQYEKPGKFSKYPQERIRDTTTELGIGFVDLYDLFRGNATKYFLQNDNVHPNEIGTTLISDGIYKYLKNMVI